MFCEVLRRTAKGFDVYVDVDGPSSYTVMTASGEIAEAGVLDAGDHSVHLLPGETIEVQDANASDFMRFTPGEGHRVLSAEEISRAKVIRRAAEAKIPGIHVGL